MFNLQGSEIIVILLLALVVLGPEKLPDAIRRFTQIYGELRKMGSGFQTELKAALDEPMREMRETADMVRDAADPDKIAAEADAGTRTGPENPSGVTDERPADATDEVPDDGTDEVPADDTAGGGDRVTADPTGGAREEAPDEDAAAQGDPPLVTPPAVPEPAEPGTPRNSIAAANSSRALTAAADRAAAATAADDGVDDGAGAPAATGPSFHSAAPRRTPPADAASGDGPADGPGDGADDGAEAPAEPSGATAAETSDETATA